MASNCNGCNSLSSRLEKMRGNLKKMKMKIIETSKLVSLYNESQSRVKQLQENLDIKTQQLTEAFQESINARQEADKAMVLNAQLQARQRQETDKKAENSLQQEVKAAQKKVEETQRLYERLKSDNKQLEDQLRGAERRASDVERQIQQIRSHRQKDKKQYELVLEDQRKKIQDLEQRLDIHNKRHHACQTDLSYLCKDHQKTDQSIQTDSHHNVPTVNLQPLELSMPSNHCNTMQDSCVESEDLGVLQTEPQAQPKPSSAGKSRKRSEIQILDQLAQISQVKTIRKYNLILSR